jgi:hypothetical protein
VLVPLYASASSFITLPSYTDNVLVYKLRVTNSAGQPMWPSSAMSISGMTVFRVRAEDHAGNVGSCDITTTIIGRVSIKPLMLHVNATYVTMKTQSPYP